MFLLVDAFPLHRVMGDVGNFVNLHGLWLEALYTAPPLGLHGVIGFVLERIIKLNEPLRR